MLNFSSTRLISVVDTVKKMPGKIFLAIFLVSFVIGGCTRGIYHTVKPGQTLYRISRTYHVDEKYLARVNGIGDPSKISVGTRVFIPGATTERRVPVVKSSSPSVKTARKSTSKPVTRKKSTDHKATVKKTPTRTTQKQAPPHHATTLKKLQWPLRGKILHSFSTHAKPGTGHGIEIAARFGSAVKAAEAGKVIYSGDGVNGYAFLVILQHENDLFTVYGFNRKNLVKQGDFVSRGEKIALSGTPPSGGQPRLHFEVRKGKRAVNPMTYLP